MNPIYLLKIEAGSNNNKFYKMTPNGATFTVEYGRVGAENPSTMEYDISLWDKKLKEKLRKGYVDQTYLVAEALSSSKSDYLPIPDASISMIVSRLQAFANQAISEAYTVSSQKVTIAMVNKAQELLDELSVTIKVQEFNSILIELFKTIPRKMKNVKDNLAYDDRDFGSIVQREQDTLDTMRGQVIQTQVTTNDGDKNETILDALGLSFSNVTQKDVLVIRKLLEHNDSNYVNAWIIQNKKTQKTFDAFVKKNSVPEKKLLWHGSRNENWWSIIQTGLLLRPNAIITGKMFGNGIYFAPKAKKSMGYTSLNNSYWARGNSPVGYLALFDVAYGIPLDVRSRIHSYSNFNYESLQREKRGAHCLHVHAGAGLFNDEIVFYDEAQMTIKYLVEIK